MKMSKVKITVGALAVAAVASLVGSVSGTLAWYQYSTRVSAAMIGTAAKCSENLKIRIYDEALDTDSETEGIQPYDTGWISDVRVADSRAYLTANSKMGSTFSPVTPGAVAKDAALPAKMHSNPIYQHFAYNRWKDARVTDYVVLPLQVKLIDVDGTDTGVYADKEVYLSDLTMVDDNAETGKADLTSALRVHFASTSNQLWSLNGDTTTTGDYLDLNGDGRYDRSFGYEDFQDTVVTKYGEDGELTSYKASGTKDTAETPLANDDEADLVVENAIPLGKTNEEGILSIKVTIWLEGWAELNAEAAVIGTLTQEQLDNLTGMVNGDTYLNSDDNKVYRYDGIDWNEVTTDSIWDATQYIGSKFNIGMSFVVDAL